MASIKDIAKKCGVSVATVSKSLNDANDISKETKDRVKQVAKEMGYYVNHYARALKTKRTNSIGILFDDEITATITHEYFLWILDSFKTETEKRGYDVTFMNHHIAGKKTSYLNYCRYRGFDGIAIINADFNNEEIQELLNSDIPTVTVDYMCKQCSTIMSDNRDGLYRLVQYAYEKGHRKIAFIHGALTNVTKDRIFGYKQAHEDLGLEIRKEYLIQGNYHDIEMCAEKTIEVLSLEDRPTCIIFPDDYSSFGGMQTIEEAGLKLPEDISTMAYDGIRMANYLGLTTFKQDTTSIGKTAAAKLIDTIEGKEETVQHVIIPGELIEGGTVADINNK